MSFNRATTGHFSGPDSETFGRSWVVGVGLSGLITVASWGDLRAYLSPRFAYTRSRATSENAAWNRHAITKTRTYAVSGSVGAEYAFARRFSVSFEAGVGYSDKDQRSSYGGYDDETSWSTRTAVAAVFNF